MTRTIVVVILILFAARPAWTQTVGERNWPGTTRSFPPELVPPEGEPVKCGLPVLNSFLSQASSRGERIQDLLASINDRSDRQLAIVRGGFCVHFDTTGENAPALLDVSGNRIEGTSRAFVDSVFAILAHVVDVEINTLHYLAPPSDGTLGGGPEYDIYIMNLGDMYGSTYPDSYDIDGGCSTTSITIDNDFTFVRPARNKGMGGLEVTLAHEFHHAIQIGHYGLWSDDLFFYEITSTWMEDVVYPDVNDYYNYLTSSSSQFRNPERPFNADDSSIPYSRAIWGHYIAKKFGADVMRETWESIRSIRPLLAIDQTLRQHGSSFGDAFADWALWNYFTGTRAKPSKYYTDGADYPLITQSAIDFPSSSRDVPGSLRSLSSTYTLVERGPDSLTVILSNTDLAGTMASSNPLLPYTIKLRSSRPDESYKQTPIGIYAGLDVADISLWSIWYAVRDTATPAVDPSQIATGRPFPAPFRPAKCSYVYIPIQGSDQLQGSLYVFNSGYELVREVSGGTSIIHLGRQMFSWDGRMNNGNLAPTGVYFFILDLPTGKIKGKIPLIRE
jgi:hypothetical protein